MFFDVMVSDLCLNKSTEINDVTDDSIYNKNTRFGINKATLILVVIWVRFLAEKDINLQTSGDENGVRYSADIDGMYRL